MLHQPLYVSLSSYHQAFKCDIWRLNNYETHLQIIIGRPKPLMKIRQVNDNLNLINNLDEIHHSQIDHLNLRMIKYNKIDFRFRCTGTRVRRGCICIYTHHCFSISNINKYKSIRNKSPIALPESVQTSFPQSAMLSGAFCGVCVDSIVFICSRWGEASSIYGDTPVSKENAVPSSFSLG